MTAVAYLRPGRRRREALLGLAPLLLLPVLLWMPAFMLSGTGPITSLTACPDGQAGGCSPVIAERVRFAIELLTVQVPPVLAAVTAVAVVWLTLARRRSWPVAALGVALTAAVVLAGIEIAQVNS